MPPTPHEAASSTGGAFPVTIEHAYGETTIDTQPERIATVAWANHEVPLALGVVPVGMSKATWGDDDGDGVLPWVEDQLDELGAETPVLFDETDGIDFEAVADTEPDVILAAYSGLTQEDYDTLSKIAPVVAYPDVAWGTSYEDMIRLNSTAIGLAAEGDQLIEDLDAEVQTALADYPELAASNVLFSYIDPADFSQIGFYTSLDTRPGFLNSLGLPEPTIVADESAGTDLFYVTVSSEEADRFADVDVFVTYGDAGRRDRLPAAGGPAAGPDPRHRERQYRCSGELHAARSLGEPLSAVDRVGHRRVLRAARGRARLSTAHVTITQTRTPLPDTAALRRPAAVRVAWLAGSLLVLCCAVRPVGRVRCSRSHARRDHRGSGR